MDHPFRSAALGGFNRQDVLDYLEKTSAENAQRQQELQQNLEAAEEERRQLAAKTAEQEEQLSILHRERDSLSQQLEQAQERTAQGDWEGAAKLSEQAFQSWQDHEEYLHILMRHSDTDEILSSFRALEQYLALEETDQYTAANAELMTQLELLAEMEQPSLVNIF